ncbi:MAG: hypothetical protein ACRD3B_03085 [Candidatus Sulfotelmatobacter sp.]
MILAITAVFAPWGFYLGGRFHILPYWQGFGTLQAKSGRYVVFVRFEPKPSGTHVYPGPTVGGRAYLCSPRGEEFRMHLGGGMPRGIGTNTNGEKISLYMYTWGAFGSFTTDHRPSIELRGQWKNPNIVMDDHSSIYRAFNPDGTVDRSHNPNKPYEGEVVHVTLTPGSYSDFEAACKSH